jgi:multidrug efflux pump
VISRFFIDRPIFATVLSVVITLAGGLAVLSLPTAQYPPISPPQVQVAINYPGASAQIVADTVAAPIEQQVNGVPGMLYMTSISGNNGTYTLFVTFNVGVNLNTALVMVQNRVQLALPLLPTSVQNQGITIRKKTPDILMVVSLYSPDDRYDQLYLSNFALINVYDPLLRVDGVSDITIMGELEYSMRAWLDPQKLASRNLNAVDVVNAVASQNLQAAPGQLGQPPSAGWQGFDLSLDTLGRLTDPEQFGDIVLKVSNSVPTSRAGSVVARSPGRAPTTGSASKTSLRPAATLTGPAGLPGFNSNTSASTTTTISNATTTSGTTNGNTTPGGAASSGTTGTSMTSGLPGGASTSGGATATGGGTTSGGANAGGGATASGAPSGTTTSTGATVSAAPTGMGIPGLQINTMSNNTSSTTTGSGAALPGQAPTTGIVRLRDVARTDLGAMNYNEACTFDGHPSAGLAIFSLPGTNTLDVAKRVRARMEELKARFPDGVTYDIGYDTTPFISESINDVIHTLFVAVGLVGVVVLVFLQNWRAVLIPMIAVPVAIIGTFAVMAAVGFSLNAISLFGLVLAIGIVVDDAIVVVENVERWLKQGYSSRDAARKAMDEVAGPVIAVALVLCAVFVPCAFISGITGRFFRQFAVTIAVSTVFSALNSLTLSPALAALLLKPARGTRGEGRGASEKEGSSLGPRPSPLAPPHRDPLTWLLDISLGWFFRLFNLVFGVGTAGYGWIIGRLLRGSFIILLIYAGLLFLTYEVFTRAPTGFVPAQDQGRVFGAIQLPDSAALWRTQETVARAEKIAHTIPGVAHTITVSGASFVQQVFASNLGTMFIVLDPFPKRRTADLSANAIMARLRKAWAREIKDGEVRAYGAPPIPGLSVAGGFKLMVQDRAGLGVDYLQKQADALIGKLQKQHGLNSVSTVFRSNVPELWLDIDRKKVASLGVSFDDLNKTLSVYLGSLYVSNFNEFGRYWQVNLQAEGQFRSRLEDINQLYVRNSQGLMVPLGTLASVREVGGPVFVQRYNLYTSAPITGGIQAGTSSGDAIAEIDALANETLPRSMGSQWTELIFLQILEGNTTAIVFALAVLAVFLALSALYESWALPLAVILVVPMCLLCSVAGVLLAHLSVDIFVQIGLVLLVGLACKNAILIVEFAKQLQQEGKTRFEATIEASRLRLRPILMTSFAFIFGVFPLVVATGAGAEMRHSLGTAVFAGMFGVTLFGIFLTPVFFYVIQGLGETQMFVAVPTRRIGSAVVGAVLGAAAGFLLGRLGIMREPWGSLIGACAGALLVTSAMALHRRIWQTGSSPLTHRLRSAAQQGPTVPLQTVDVSANGQPPSDHDAKNAPEGQP